MIFSRDRINKEKIAYNLEMAESAERRGRDDKYPQNAFDDEACPI